MFRRILSIKMIFFYLCALMVGFLLGYDFAILTSDDSRQGVNPNACYSASESTCQNEASKDDNSTDKLNSGCFPDN